MTDDHDRAVLCEVCDDSGWERFECTGDRACGRFRQHPRHEYVIPCGCRSMNRNYQAAIERLRKRAA